jgi:hypothetical protein
VYKHDEMFEASRRLFAISISNDNVSPIAPNQHGSKKNYEMKTGTVIIWLSILLANPSTAVPIQGASEMAASQPIGIQDNQSPPDSKRPVDKTEKTIPDRNRDQRATVLALRGGTGHMPGHIKTRLPGPVTDVHALGSGGRWTERIGKSSKSHFQTVRLKDLTHLPADAARISPIPVRSGRLTKELGSEWW